MQNSSNGQPAKLSCDNCQRMSDFDSCQNQTSADNYHMKVSRVVRLMNFAKFSVHAVTLFISTNILPLPLLYFKNCSILMHDVYNKVVPSNSSNLFTPTKDVHHHNTCSSTAGDVYINNSRLIPALQELFSHYGRKYLEQCIPDVMKQLPKYRLKKKIIESLLQIFLKTGFLSWYRYVYKRNCN